MELYLEVVTASVKDFLKENIIHMALKLQNPLPNKGL